MTKSLLLIFTFLVLSFVSCSNGNDNEDTELGTKWVQIKVKFNLPANKGPEGEVCVFYLDNVFPKDLEPGWASDGSKIMFFLNDVNNEFILPVYTNKLKSDTDSKTGKYINLSTKSIYSYELSSIYGIPNPKGRFLLVLRVWRDTPDYDAKGYSYTYKEISFDDLKLEKTFELNPGNDKLEGISRYYDKW